MVNPDDYNEQNISQKPAIEVLNNLGYKIIAPKDAEAYERQFIQCASNPNTKKTA